MKKILVIDDETPVRQAVRVTLSSQGYTVIEANTGESGLAQGVAEQPDLIISDVNMQGMSGFTVLQRLRAEPKTAAIPVILMTGVPEQATVRSSMEKGADDYLMKPFGSKVLLAAVKARLERQELIQASARATEAKLLGLLSATHDLIAIADPHTLCLLYLNAAGRKMIEVGPEDPIGQIRLADFVRDELQNSLEERLARARAAEICITETELVSRNGNRIPVSEQIMVHPHDGEAVAYISIVARDITERRRAELELAQTHQELVEASRQAGKAELATAVLHNVGNVLTSINVASDCMSASLRKSSTDKLSKVVALLHQHQSDLGLFLSSDPKGQKIPGYLAQLDEHLLKERQEVLVELARLQKGVQHIKSIVSLQQNLARAAGQSEVLRISELVDEALAISSINNSGLAVEVIQQIQHDLRIIGDKHKILQILINLLGNAKQACEATNHPQKKVTISANASDGRIRIAVSDTGIGIAAADLDRIFSRGFTTKKTGHGFGLHYSSIVAKELDGALTVRSAGPMKGATFTLEIPANCG